MSKILLKLKMIKSQSKSEELDDVDLNSESNFQSLENITSNSPDYATIDFRHQNQNRSLSVANSCLSPKEGEKSEKVSPPQRGIKKKKMNKIGGVQTPSKYPQIPSNLLASKNHHHNSTTRIYQNLPMYTSGRAVSHVSGSEDNEEILEERDRQFATAICIFSSVLTMVLVLMFYLVGEAAFRSILLILAFVFFLTLFLACFLRRPTAIVFTGSNHNFLPSSSTITTHKTPAYHLSNYHLSPPSSHHLQNHLQNNSIFMISPPPNGVIHPQCPVHSRPESSNFYIENTTANTSPLPPPTSQSPPLPPKSSTSSPPPPVPPIQTIPSRIPTTSKVSESSNKNNRNSASSFSTFSQDSLEIIDKIETEKLQYKY